MPEFKIGGDYGYAGTDWSDIIEAEDLEEAEEVAKEIVLAQVEWWAIPVDEEDEDDS